MPNTSPVELQKIAASQILIDLGLDRFSHVERNVVSFLALVGIRPNESWLDIEPVPLGISPILDFVRTHYQIDYAPNTRETIRKDSVKPLEQCGILIRNYEDPTRPTNSPQTDYLIDPTLTQALRHFGTEKWKAFAQRYRKRMPLTIKEQSSRKVSVPVSLPDGSKLNLSPGPHSRLIRSIIEEFTHHFTPDGAQVAYIGDTADNKGLSDEQLLKQLEIDILNAPEKPDVILWYPAKKWLIYLEAIHSSGHFDEARKKLLSTLSGKYDPIYISCFQDRKATARAFATIASQTEVWIADEPSHLIHFDGERFLGPYR